MDLSRLKGYGISSEQSVQRLTALWALSEAGLGGILHAVKLPFTGMLIASLAVMLITLIHQFSDSGGQKILKALVIVLVIKASVSPHSPVMAYFAVCFQGLFGALIFSIIKNVRIAAFLIGVVALFESSLQKLINLTVLFGKSIWEAFDLFIEYVVAQFGFTIDAYYDPSIWLIIMYVGMYMLTGIAVGLYAGVLPKRILKTWEFGDVNQILSYSAEKQ